MRFVLAVLALLWAGAAVATPAQDFQALLADHWAWVLRNNPEFATQLGERAYDDRLSDLSLAHIDASARDAAGFLARADAIPAQALSPADALNRDILRRVLAREVEGARFGQRAMIFGNRSGWHTNAAGWPDTLPFYGLADYRSYVARLKAYPAQNAAGIETVRWAVAHGFVLPCAAMGGFEKTIQGEIVGDPDASDFMKPFAHRPAAVGENDWAALRGEARATIRDSVIPAYRAFLRFYTADYAPHCRREIGASALPDGAAWYAFLARQETTTDLTPAQIHALGLSEVARIRAEMEQVAARAGFAGDRKGFVARLRTDPEYFPRSGDDLIAAASVMTKRIDGEMPKYFGRLPRLPYTVKPVPDATADGTTTAYYEPGSPESGRAGVYRVNLTHLDQRPLWELPSLTLHEAVPGHHNQIALQQELDYPLFRRHIAYFTAFTEGWGLYSERLGIPMGLYDTPERDMGRLSYEMWRACRLVVDTGMHTMGMSKAQAIAFMADNTALTPANIEAEVNRYIAGPGQALAYKIGELRIRSLRAEAEQALGPKFDIRGFHDAVLGQGSVPMDVLERQVRAWIAARRAAG